MTRRTLRAQFTHAWKTANSLRWQREVRRLNLALMRQELGLDMP